MADIAQTVERPELENKTYLDITEALNSVMERLEDQANGGNNVSIGNGTRLDEATGLELYNYCKKTKKPVAFQLSLEDGVQERNYPSKKEGDMTFYTVYSAFVSGTSPTSKEDIHFENSFSVGDYTYLMAALQMDVIDEKDPIFCKVSRQKNTDDSKAVDHYYSLFLTDKDGKKLSLGNTPAQIQSGVAEMQEAAEQGTKSKTVSKFGKKG